MAEERPTQQNPSPAPQETMRSAILRTVVVFTLCFLLACLVWFKPAWGLPGISHVRKALQDLMVFLGIHQPFAWGVKGILVVSLGIGAARLLSGRKVPLASRKMPRDVWNLIGLSLLVALPFLLVLGFSPQMHLYYAKLFGPKGWQWITANAIAILTEHAWVEGVLLGAALPASVLAMSPEVARTGRLARFGLGFPVGGERTLSAWLGVPPLAWPAIISQGVLFYLVHFTKVPMEVATSLPGGIAVGWLSFRARSFWPGMFLHLATGAVVLVTMALTR